MDAAQQSAAWARIAASARQDRSDVSLATAGHACAGDLGADSLGIVVITTGRVRTVALATDERSARLENTQLVSGEGPCTEAYTGAELVQVPDLRRNPERWPVFAEVAQALGIRSVTAIPLEVGAVRIGAIDLYHTSPTSLGPTARARLEAYARILAVLILDAHPYLMGTGVPPVPGPPGFPPTVHQAAGALAVQQDMSTDTALVRLRAHAYRHDQPLLDVAQQVLDGRLHLEGDPDPDVS
ncbi:GAF and ANTAR domain-containing protein [Streptomyces beigongshangae]|uniref:GAF and ANTAR domain-containing protein n=1 Tax=Streptomyces beigongshangae TaxID=2841597 RepID=UPI001C859CC3|nr:GAF and ANTAR domain-containing protein [Streptomyces sp. REN17]